MVLSTLTSKIKPGNPQYSAGPWATGIWGVYQASITLKFSSSFSLVLSFSVFFLISLQEKSYQFNSELGTNALAF